MLPEDKPNEVSVWDGNNTCPFCGVGLSDPGAGFIDHTKASPYCRGAFDVWRDRVASDMSGEWLK
ncbi:MAG: DUF7501 family protein [Halodesulfurarchaeum sp.]